MVVKLEGGIISEGSGIWGSSCRSIGTLEKESSALEYTGGWFLKNEVCRLNGYTESHSTSSTGCVPLNVGCGSPITVIVCGASIWIDGKPSSPMSTGVLVEEYELVGTSICKCFDPASVLAVVVWAAPIWDDGKLGWPLSAEILEPEWKVAGTSICKGFGWDKMPKIGAGVIVVRGAKTSSPMLSGIECNASWWPRLASTLKSAAWDVNKRVSSRCGPAMLMLPLWTESDTLIMFPSSDSKPELTLSNLLDIVSFFSSPTSFASSSVAFGESSGLEENDSLSISPFSAFVSMPCCNMSNWSCKCSWSTCCCWSWSFSFCCCRSCFCFSISVFWSPWFGIIIIKIKMWQGPYIGNCVKKMSYKIELVNRLSVMLSSMLIIIHWNLNWFGLKCKVE